MLIKSVLVHHPLAEVCYLREALMWVAFKRFPLADEVSDEIQNPTRQECAPVGVPAKPIYSGTLPGFTPENLKELADFRGAAERRQSFEREIAITVEYQDSCKRWDQELYDFMDRHRTQLCVALRDGKLVAKGVRPTDGTNEQTEYKWVSIPTNVWIYDNINWDKSRVEGRSGAFELIQVNTEQLFACFPPPVAAPETVMRVANDLVSGDPRRLSRRVESGGGRPMIGTHSTSQSRCGFTRRVASPRSTMH